MKMKYSDDILEHNGLSWFSEKDRIIYLGIPKTTSTSMRHTFKIDKNVMNMNCVPVEKKEYRKFTVIREPVQRFVSGMWESFDRNETPKKIKNLKNYKSKKRMIEDYLDIIEENGFLEVHTTPQSFFFCNKKGEEFDFDRVLIFENITEDFSDMCSDFDIQKNLEHKQMGNKKMASQTLKEIQDNNSLMVRIKKIYKKDFELYNKYNK